MTSYQVVGKHLANDIPLCWKGKTADDELAAKRLLVAQAYATTRLKFNGEPMEWWIEQSVRRAKSEDL